MSIFVAVADSLGSFAASVSGTGMSPSSCQEDDLEGSWDDAYGASGSSYCIGCTGHCRQKSSQMKRG